jgi:CAAX prenyl protease-like protein
MGPVPGDVARRGHGWWPYLAPVFAFLLLGELAARAPAPLAPWFLPARVLLPGALLALFFAAGAYPELRSPPPGGAASLLLDVLVGLAGAAAWMAPYVLLGREALPEWMRPPADASFDSGIFGADREALALALRLAGYALVTPFAEELFVRGWLARWIEVFDSNRDFREVPIARPSRRSFAAVVVFFTAGHVMWEWPVAVLWVVGTQLWFYRRRHLGALVLVHAASNLAIFAAVLVAARAGHDLWYFL